MTALVRADVVKTVLFQFGAHRSLDGMLTVDQVRALADEYRSDNGADGRALAEALDGLARKAAARAAIERQRHRTAQAGRP